MAKVKITKNHVRKDGQVNKGHKIAFALSVLAKQVQVESP